MIYHHFYDNDDVTSLDEWNLLKYHLLRRKVPSVENLKADGLTLTEWCLTKIIECKHEFYHMCPKLTKVVEIVLTVSVSNAWPQRGASKVKLVKTDLRNTLKNDMLDV